MPKTESRSCARIPQAAGHRGSGASGDPKVGVFSDAVVLKIFGDVPKNLSEC
jgi:hypothetical protein